MAESILVTGKKISSMELVTNVTGNEKIPTGQPDDLALTPNQIADHTIARGDLANQEDLSQVEVELSSQITSTDNSIRGLIAAEEAARIAADNLKVDKVGSVSSVAGRVGDVVLAPSDVLVEGFGSQEDVNKYVAKPFLSGYTYGLGERVVLNSGEIVKSTVDGNVSDPNGGMVGWVSVISDGLSDTIQTFNTPEAGVDAVTGVADGAYFNVRSSNDESYGDEYQNVGGVPTPTGKSYPSSTLVQNVRIKAPYFFNTVSDMVTANNISDGMIVGTKGYHNVFDDGGAIYLISSVATDYSIPLANDLHAVFRDTFDIRKFGIVSSKTLDQTENIRRMIAYADSREYEIDFHNFDIVVPDIFQFRTTGRANLNCMGFNYLHEIKNLNLYHDQTKQLKPGKCMLGFYPKQNLNGVFKLKNVRFDAWSDNYTRIDPEVGTNVGEGDGSMHGFSTFRHPEWTDFLDKTDEFYNISFDLSDIEFISNAVSYNIEIARLAAKRTVLRNISGEYLALMVHFYTKDLHAENIHGVYREDRRAGRTLVTNLLHCEPAIVAGKSLKMGTWYLENASSKRYADGSLYSVLKYHAMGASTEIEKIHLKNIHGDFGSNASLDVGYTFLLKTLIVEDSETTLAGAYEANYVELSDSKFSSNIMPRSYRWDRFKANNCELNALFFDTAESGVDQGDFEFIECRFTNRYGVGHSRPSSRWFNSISLLNCNFAQNIIETGFGKLDVIGGQVATESDVTGDTIVPTKVADGDTRPSEIYIDGVRSTKPQAASSFFVKGTFAPDRPINLLAVNNVTVSKLNWSGANVSAKSIGNVFANSVTTVVYDPPSLAPIGTAGDTVTTTVTVQGAVVGDIVQAAFSRYNTNIRIYPVVSAANTVTVEFKNIGTTAVDLASGTLEVKLI